MSRDDVDALDDDVTSLLREEKQREPVSAQVSARIRERVSASVGLGVGLGVASGAKALVASGAKATAATSTASTAVGAASVVVTPKAIAIVSAMLLAGGVSVTVATKVWAPVAAPRYTEVSASAPDGTAPVVAQVVDPTAAVVEADPVVEADLVVAPIIETTPLEANTSVTAGSSRDRDLALERKLLEQARQAAAFRRWDAAVAALEQHRRKFPRGRLTEERESLHVPVLVMLGRHDEARQAAQRFHARYPKSIFAAGVHQALASIP